MDGGEFWIVINGELLMGLVNVIKEDFVNVNLFYLGIDFGVFVLFD